MTDRPPTFDRDTYEQRNTAERCFNKLMQHRAVATRHNASRASASSESMAGLAALA